MLQKSTSCCFVCFDFACKVTTNSRFHQTNTTKSEATPRKKTIHPQATLNSRTRAFARSVQCSTVFPSSPHQLCFRACVRDINKVSILTSVHITTNELDTHPTMHIQLTNEPAKPQNNVQNQKKYPRNQYFSQKHLVRINKTSNFALQLF